MNKCSFSSGHTQRFGYTASKGRVEEARNAVFGVGTYVTIRDNTVLNSFNGVGLYGSKTNYSMSSDTDVEGNIIEHMADDAIEAESGHVVNLRVTNNKTKWVAHGISMAPIYTGPAFYVRNLLRIGGTTGGSGFKHGTGAVDSSRGVAYIYHNTVVPMDTSVSTICWYNPGPSSAAVYRKHARNNVFKGSPSSASPTVRATQANSLLLAGAAGCSFNYNLMARAGNAGTTVAQINNSTNRNQSYWQTTVLQDVNGVFQEPGFADTARANFTASRGINVAQRIAGINHTIAAPDMGYAEYIPPAAARKRGWLRRFIDIIL